MAAEKLFKTNIITVREDVTMNFVDNNFQYCFHFRRVGSRGNSAHSCVISVYVDWPINWFFLWKLLTNNSRHPCQDHDNPQSKYDLNQAWHLLRILTTSSLKGLMDVIILCLSFYLLRKNENFLITGCVFILQHWLFFFVSLMSFEMASCSMKYALCKDNCLDLTVIPLSFSLSRPLSLFSEWHPAL